MPIEIRAFAVIAQNCRETLFSRSPCGGSAHMAKANRRPRSYRREEKSQAGESLLSLGKKPNRLMLLCITNQRIQQGQTLKHGRSITLGKPYHFCFWVLGTRVDASRWSVSTKHSILHALQNTKPEQTWDWQHRRLIIPNPVYCLIPSSSSMEKQL